MKVKCGLKHKVDLVYRLNLYGFSLGISPRLSSTAPPSCPPAPPCPIRSLRSSTPTLARVSRRLWAPGPTRTGCSPRLLPPASQKPWRTTKTGPSVRPLGFWSGSSLQQVSHSLFFCGFRLKSGLLLTSASKIEPMKALDSRFTERSKATPGIPSAISSTAGLAPLER